MAKKIANWTLDDLERMKEFSELDVYYEMLDIMVQLEPYAERAAMDKKAAKRVLARESRNLKFLAEVMRGMTTSYTKGDVPTALANRIKLERVKREKAEATLQARKENLDRVNEDNRMTQLRAAMEEMKRKNEERKKENQPEAPGDNQEAQDQL